MPTAVSRRARARLRLRRGAHLRAAAAVGGGGGGAGGQARGRRRAGPRLRAAARTVRRAARRGPRARRGRYRDAGLQRHHAALRPRRADWGDGTRCYETPVGVQWLTEAEAFDLYRPHRRARPPAWRSTCTPGAPDRGRRCAAPTRARFAWHGNRPDRFNDTLVLLLDRGRRPPTRARVPRQHRHRRPRLRRRQLVVAAAQPALPLRQRLAPRATTPGTSTRTATACATTSNHQRPLGQRPQRLAARRPAPGPRPRRQRATTSTWARSTRPLGSRRGGRLVRRLPGHPRHGQLDRVHHQRLDRRWATAVDYFLHRRAATSTRRGLTGPCTPRRHPRLPLPASSHSRSPHTGDTSTGDDATSSTSTTARPPTRAGPEVVYVFTADTSGTLTATRRRRHRRRGATPTSTCSTPTTPAPAPGARRRVAHPARSAPGATSSSPTRTATGGVEQVGPYRLDVTFL
ncbi:MAG: hypothetical protein MZU95_03330 [Desulfomicrobium escambiense]|nr:hypothetical protein [Desulfomicrobium escambiense]